MSVLESEFRIPRPALSTAASVLKFLATLVAGAFVAYGSAQYSAATRAAATKARLDAIETRVTVIDAQIVPRREHEAHWQTIEGSQAGLREDVRDVRETQTKMLLLLSSGDRKK